MEIDSNQRKKLKHIDPSLPRKETLLTEHHHTWSDKDIPQFSFIEFNLSGLCNRICGFCPRSDPAVYPNINEHMPLAVYQSVLKDLNKIKFCGTIIFSAFSEPLLYKELESAVQLASELCPLARTELVTNGDKLTLDRINTLFNAGLSMLAVSMYDGPHQLGQFKKLQEQAGLTDEQMKFRVRWLDAKEHFGLTLSNRAGSVEVKDAGLVALTEPLNSPCHYPFYQIVIDYDGSALLCAHDWAKKLIVGDVNSDSILDIWNNAVLEKVRRSLINGDRSFKPCDRCDVAGVLIGKESFNQWVAYYAKKSQPSR